MFGPFSGRHTEPVTLEPDIPGELAHIPVPLNLAGVGVRESKPFVLDGRFGRLDPDIQIARPITDLPQPAHQLVIPGHGRRRRGRVEDGAAKINIAGLFFPVRGSFECCPTCLRAFAMIILLKIPACPTGSASVAVRRQQDSPPGHRGSS